MGVHCGTGVGSEDVGWHIDAANSMLHCAVSLQGQRTLVSRWATTPKGEKEQHDDEQEAGCVYISNPHSFLHGVIYPEVGWDHRIIACQFCLLMTEEQIFSSEAARGESALVDLLGPRAAPVRLPTLSEV